MRLNYEVVDGGHQNWMVFLHGAGGNIQTWKFQRDTFKAHYNLLLIDLRDHGDSQDGQTKKRLSFEMVATDVLNLLEELKIPPAIFVALSMGSLVIQKISEINPKVIKKAVIAGGIFDVNGWIRLFARSAISFGYLIPHRWSYWLFSWLMMPKRNHQKSRQVYMEQARKLTASAYRRWLGLYSEFSSMVRSYQQHPLSYPLLAVNGGEDYVFLKAARDFTEKHPTAELVVIPKCGHICNIEKADEFNAIALEWLEG